MPFSNDTTNNNKSFPPITPKHASKSSRFWTNFATILYGLFAVSRIITKKIRFQSLHVQHASPSSHFVRFRANPFTPFLRLRANTHGDTSNVSIIADGLDKGKDTNSHLAVQSCEYRGLLANQRPGIRMKKDDWVYWAIWMNGMTEITDYRNKRGFTGLVIPWVRPLLGRYRSEEARYT